MAKSLANQLVVCVNNQAFLASLEARKIYVRVRDPVAEKLGMFRIIDESEKDYLYPKALFRTITLPHVVRKAVLASVPFP